MCPSASSMFAPLEGRTYPRQKKENRDSVSRQLVDKQSPAKSSFKLQGSQIALERDDKGGGLDAVPACE